MTTDSPSPISRLLMLLRVSATERDHYRLDLAAAMKSLDHLRAQMLELAGEMERLQQTTRDATRPGSLNMNRLLNTYRYDILLEFREQQLVQRERAMREVVEAKRELVIEADREVRVLERLLQQEEQKRQHLEQRREQLLLDELAHHRFAG